MTTERGEPLIMRLINWLFWQFRKRCKHDGLDVAADILEGSGGHIDVAWCHRCGAYKIIYRNATVAVWRKPRATWTGPGR